MQELYLGIMTGTSLDAVDTALVSFSASSCQLEATHEHPFPAKLKQQLQALIEQPDNIALDDLGRIDRELGLLYAQSVITLLEKSGTDKARVKAIGCHGQTIRHRPDSDPAFTMQIGDAATLANLTGITTVADFRSADIALGGQGAPLAPLFHHWLLGPLDQAAAVINIGGIANISVIKPGEALIGFDTGPGNILLDSWCMTHKKEAYDKDGAWAATGVMVDALLQDMRRDPYFLLEPPKSTGREYFNSLWIKKYIAGMGGINPADIQATLAELTATTIAAAVLQYLPDANVWLCGGGAANTDLVGRLRSHCPAAQINTTDELGIPPAWIESAAFAWLARARINEQAIATPPVTGARRGAVLGTVHCAAKM